MSVGRAGSGSFSLLALTCSAETVFLKHSYVCCAAMAREVLCRTPAAELLGLSLATAQTVPKSKEEGQEGEVRQRQLCSGVAKAYCSGLKNLSDT